MVMQEADHCTSWHLQGTTAAQQRPAQCTHYMLVPYYKHVSKPHCRSTTPPAAHQMSSSAVHDTRHTCSFLQNGTAISKAISKLCALTCSASYELQCCAAVVCCCLPLPQLQQCCCPVGKRRHGCGIVVQRCCVQQCSLLEEASPARKQRMQSCIANARC
jgi:hypothetical protein